MNNLQLYPRRHRVFGGIDKVITCLYDPLIDRLESMMNEVQQFSTSP